MTQYIQYDETGNITATIIAFSAAPDHPRQLALDEAVDVSGKKVDVATGALIEVPEVPLTEE